MKGIPLPPTSTSPGPAPGAPATAPIHGRHGAQLDAARSLEADRRARELLADEELARLLTPNRERANIDRARQVFVNRNLRMAKIELIGFDMDYTLAIYHMRRIEQLSYEMTLRRLTRSYGYQEEIARIPYDHLFGMRGLMVDKANGNLIKMDRFGHVGRAYHGMRPLPQDIYYKLYRNERVRVKNPQYAWIDTLFALPEACLYAGIIELMESLGQPVDYGKLYDAIREAIDTVHRDGSLKAEIQKDIGRYIFKDPELGPALHKLRSGGKKLFLLTNSMWDYTDGVMRYLLDGVLPEYPSWRNYFDLICCGSQKPGFFSEQRPFLEVDTSSEECRLWGEASSLERWKVYQGGNLADFERMSGFSGDAILYVGDHIYGDILKSKKTSLWRTCMVVQEIEDEINYTELRKEEISRLSELELVRARLDDEVNQRKAQLNLLERRLEKDDPDGQERSRLEEERRRAKAELDKLRKSLKETTELADTLEADVEAGFNPYWGLLFKEGSENSKFGEQVEQYACVYTSRASNLLHYSPMQYYRSPRELMPHEQAGALSGKLSPLGGEGPPRGSGKE
ncbi:MAG: HAD-IG family 5'-nucleotidase [Myxococcales bacterium]|nr:HAD-IG family 5'-nucleotidase [Myxococcales bacterium]